MMMLKVNNVVRGIFSKFFIIRSECIHNRVIKMDKAYLRHCPDGERFDITFELTDDKIKRKFNFTRNLSETIDTFLNRVKTNIDKALRKKSKSNKNKTADVESPTVFLSSLENKELSKEQTCEEVFRPGSALQLCVDDKTFRVVINSPWVLTINLPTSILANFPTYPSKFETVFTDLGITDFIWYRSNDSVKWEEVGRDFIYIPSTDDVDCFLKFSCTPKNEELVGPTFETVSSCKVLPSPGECPFERRHVFTKEKLRGSKFRVVSYNILADLYCDSDYSREVLFPYCPAYALAIDYRKQLFLKEIIGYNADIICLQEVDKKVFKYDLNPALSHLGYGGTLDLKGDVAEGLAFFYNTNRFILLDSHKLLFSEKIDKDPVFAEIWTRIKKNEHLSTRILNRSTTLQLNVVGSLDRNEILVVANTHLYFHEDADHIRLLHGCLAIRYIEHFVNQIKERYINKRISVIFCGDFNSVPSCGIYKLYTTGFVPGNYVDYSSNKDEEIENINMNQPFKLASACGTPKYTNFTATFADCLDYIFYEKTNLAISQDIPLPSEEELRANTAIPSTVFASDHIALVSDLMWL